MDILRRMSTEGHEQVAMFSDPGSGLKAIIAVHDTTLGPACGGTRMWPYESETEALTDALRLSQAMTYKSAAAGLHLGGGKGVIIGDPHSDKSEALMRAYGRFVDTLGGRYLTTTDVGTTGRDLEYVRQETRHVTGLPLSLGGSGDTSIMTGLGLYMGMKACAEEVWGNEGLRGKTVAVQGFGKVASHLCEHLLDEDARLVVTDVHDGALDRARDMGLEVTSPDSIIGVDCDIFAPCALGGVLNPQTIPQLRCRVVAGGANNQLLTEADGEELHRRGILYAPGLHRQRRRHHQRRGRAGRRRVQPGTRPRKDRAHPRNHGQRHQNLAVPGNLDGRRRRPSGRGAAEQRPGRPSGPAPPMLIKPSPGMLLTWMDRIYRMRGNSSRRDGWGRPEGQGTAPSLRNTSASFSTPSHISASEGKAKHNRM